MSLSTRFLAIVLAIALFGKYLFGCAYAMAAKPAYAPVPKVRYEKSELTASVDLYRQVPMQFILDSIVGALGMPHPIDVVVGDCGDANAYYFPAYRTVAMCTELEVYMEYVQELNYQQRIDALTFVFAHELSHALIHELDLPVTAGHEDLADSLASYMLASLGPRGVEVLMGGADWLDTINTEVDPADLHPAGPTRAANVRCYVAGYDDYHENDPRDYELPGFRLARCPSEFESKTKSWTRALLPHLL